MNHRDVARQPPTEARAGSAGPALRHIEHGMLGAHDPPNSGETCGNTELVQSEKVLRVNRVGPQGTQPLHEAPAEAIPAKDIYRGDTQIDGRDAVFRASLQ